MKNWVLDNKNGIFWTIILVLLASLSFALGYLYAKDQARAPIIIEKCGQTAANLP